MLYRTKVTYRAGGRQYAPGALLPDDIPQADLGFLRGRGWLEPVDAAPAALEGLGVGMGMEDGSEGDGVGLAGAGSPDVWKMRSKKEVHAYAQAIGLDLGEEYEKAPLKELQRKVVDFLDETAGFFGGGEDGLHGF